MEILLENKELYNPERLCNEISVITEKCNIYHNNDDYTIEFDGATEDQIMAIIRNHNPEPLPVKKTEIELLQDEILANKLAMAELIETIMGGGEIE